MGFHDRKQRWACIVAHRRAGKTTACVNDLLKAAIDSDRDRPRFCYISPLYKQSKDIAWDALKHFAGPLTAIGAEFNESELRVDFPNGGRVRLYGADNPDSLRGIYLDGVVIDEPAQIRPSLWTEVVRPALSDRQGWAAFIGTPAGKNDFYDIAERAKASEDWFYLQLKASETGLLDEQELFDARQQMGQDRYDQEYECSFEAAIQGAYYAEALKRVRADGRLGRVPIERAIPVSTAWDLGVSDSTAIWFVQIVGREVRVIDYEEGSGVGLDEYSRILRDRGYLYGTHYLPHDIAVRELSTGKSRLETLRGLGLGDIQVVPQHNVQDGINAVRRLLDRVWIDEARCKRGVECLWQYRREWDEKGKTWRNNPLHDWTSHGADAFRTFAAGWAEPELKKTADRWGDGYRSPSRSQSWTVA
jgi:hypothetical protein